MTAVNMDLLQSQHPALHRLVASHLDIRQSFGDAVEVDLDELPVDIRHRLSKWLERQPAPPPAPPPEPLPPQINMQELQQGWEKDMQSRADEAAAKAHLDRYVAEQNLEPSDYNLGVIVNWLKENAQMYLSVANVDRCIAACRNNLRWFAPPPTEPQEVLADWQIPIDSDERTMRKASTKALLDLNLRRRKLTGQVYADNSARFHGSFSSKF